MLFSGTPCQIAALKSFLKRIIIIFLLWISFVTACLLTAVLKKIFGGT